MGEGKEKMSIRKKIILAVILVLLLAGGTLAVLGGYTPFYRTFLQAEAEPGFAEKIRGIENIDYVAIINPELYRGAYPVENLPALKDLGIKTIINFRYMEIHSYEEEAEAAGFQYHWMPINPGVPPDEKFIGRFFEIINNPENQPVYIHCNMGIDRTGLMSGIYRIEHDGWNNERAVREMEYFGHNELWHDLEEALKNYEKKGPVEGK